MFNRGSSSPDGSCAAEAKTVTSRALCVADVDPFVGQDTSVRVHN